MDGLSQPTLEVLAKIGAASSGTILALIVIGMIKGWIWPAPAVQELQRQRDLLLASNERLMTALDALGRPGRPQQ